MTNRARSSSPRSVARTHRDVASSKRASVTRVWNSARRYRSKVRPKAWQWREDLRLEHVLHGGDRADLFEERQVDVRLHVARRARVAVPVPGAPEVTAALEDEEVVDALLRQARRGEHPGEPATDDHDIGLDLLRGSLLDGGVRVFGVVLQLARHRAELRQTFGPHGPPLVALLVVLLLEGDRVEVESVGVRHRKVTVHCHADDAEAAEYRHDLVGHRHRNGEVFGLGYLADVLRDVVGGRAPSSQRPSNRRRGPGKHGRSVRRRRR